MASITLRQSTKYGTEPYIVLTVTQASQSQSGNGSYVNWNLTIYRPSKVISSASKKYSVVINGSTVKSDSTTIGGTGTKTIASGRSVWVPHNADGTKTLSFKATFNFAVTWSGTYIGELSKSGSMVLTSLAKNMSTLSFSGGPPFLADGTTQYIPIVTQKSSGVTDTIKLKSDKGEQVQTISLSNNTAFTIPVSWNTLIPADSKTITAVAEIKTANNSDGKEVGTGETEVLIEMPERYGNAMEPPQAYIKSKTSSTIVLELIPPTQYAYGAKFSHWNIAFKDGNDLGDFSINGNTVTITKDIMDNRLIEIVVAAVDSRGFISPSITVPCFVPLKGFCIYDGAWRQATPYINGEPVNAAVYMNNKWHYYIYRT